MLDACTRWRVARKRVADEVHAARYSAGYLVRPSHPWSRQGNVNVMLDGVPAASRWPALERSTRTEHSVRSTRYRYLPSARPPPARRRDAAVVPQRQGGPRGGQRDEAERQGSKVTGPSSGDNSEFHVIIVESFENSLTNLEISRHAGILSDISLFCSLCEFRNAESASLTSILTDLNVQQRGFSDDCGEIQEEYAILRSGPPCPPRALDDRMTGQID